VPDFVQYPNAALKQTLEQFDFENPPVDPVELAHTLTKAMLSEDAMGLAANQLGLPYRVFVIKANPVLCCFNPRIIDEGEETAIMEEGCLSFKGGYVKVKRPRRIKVRYTLPNGEVVTEKYIDMTARVFQHELDHLDGITMLERASFLERERYHKRKKKAERAK
jgi:peptide deformylase